MKEKNLKQKVNLDSKAIRKLIEEEPNLTIAEFRKRLGYKYQKNGKGGNN